jgi:hypothetical protein
MNDMIRLGEGERPTIVHKKPRERMFGPIPRGIFQDFIAQPLKKPYDMPIMSPDGRYAGNRSLSA